jgi:hypothetical protein
MSGMQCAGVRPWDAVPWRKTYPCQYLSREQCVAALCSSCSLQKHLERWPADLNEAGLLVLMLMKRPKILRAELNTVHLYQHYSLYMPNKLQYTWREDGCGCVRPAKLSVITEVRTPFLLEQHPRYVPHRDRAGYNNFVKYHKGNSVETRLQQVIWN